MKEDNRQLKPLKRLTVISLLLLFAGCLQTTILKNGYSKAPSNPKVFKNRVYFEKSILTELDTTAIYEKVENNYYEGFVKQENVLGRLNFADPNSSYAVYRFYGNGCYNLFVLDRKDPVLTKQMFDPAYRGWRGVLYRKKGSISGDLITQVGQLGWQIGRQTEKFSVEGDSLFVEVKNLHKYVFVKRRIDLELLQHHADW